MLRNISADVNMIVLQMMNFMEVNFWSMIAMAKQNQIKQVQECVRMVKAGPWQGRETGSEVKV